HSGNRYHCDTCTDFDFDQCQARIKKQQECFSKAPHEHPVKPIPVRPVPSQLKRLTPKDRKSEQSIHPRSIGDGHRSSCQAGFPAALR
ncbi:unnamed protein product, partial [Ascophyllum nodosum]